jgi:hypothetical protein
MPVASDSRHEWRALRADQRVITPRNGGASSPLFRRHDLQEEKMPNVYVEARPKGRPNNSPIEDYVVEDRANRVLARFKDQSVAWARKEGHKPLVARVRNLSDKEKPHHWSA